MVNGLCKGFICSHTNMSISHCQYCGRVFWIGPLMYDKKTNQTYVWGYYKVTSSLERERGRHRIVTVPKRHFAYFAVWEPFFVKKHDHIFCGWGIAGVWNTTAYSTPSSLVINAPKWHKPRRLVFGSLWSTDVNLPRLWFYWHITIVIIKRTEMLKLILGLGNHCCVLIITIDVH